MKVAFDTDVNVVALFEHMYGGHDDAKQNLCYITVGTGIGLGLVINGQTVHGLIHPEGGHIRIPLLPEDDSFPGVCPYHGKCLEGLCTNVAIAKRKGLADVEMNKNIPDDDDVWNRVGYYLGTCCANLILTCSVEKIILGGGVMNREILYGLVRKHCFQQLNKYLDNPKLASLEAMENMIVKSKYETDLTTLAAAIVGSHSKDHI